MTDFSILDLVPVRQGGTLGEAFDAATTLARTAEKVGCKRFWVAEHHAMEGIAGGATSVVLAHIGNATSTIRIGSGGIMLPNHTPFQIAEQFGTLDALFPGRIDLGLGRAPGAGPELQRALRKDLHRAAEMFPQDVVELMAFIPPPDWARNPNSGCWDRACSARNSPRSWACLTLLPAISPRIISMGRSSFIGAISSRPRHGKSRMSWLR